jgi:hypothetical protein
MYTHETDNKSHLRFFSRIPFLVSFSPLYLFMYPSLSELFFIIDIPLINSSISSTFRLIIRILLPVFCPYTFPCFSHYFVRCPCCLFACISALLNFPMLKPKFWNSAERISVPSFLNPFVQSASIPYRCYVKSVMILTWQRLHTQQ